MNTTGRVSQSESSWSWAPSSGLPAAGCGGDGGRYPSCSQALAPSRLVLLPENNKSLCGNNQEEETLNYEATRW